MRVIVGAQTDVGAVRDHNEDAYLADGPFYAVADGMGGHRGGEVASRVALEKVTELTRDEDEVDLAEAVRSANQAILEQAARDRELAGMGTTLTLLRTEADRVSFAHVGDSRAYLLRDGELRQLTDDHTLVNRMVREGKITEEEASIHPHRSILTRALGVEPELEVDLGGQEVRVGDRIMLCSDGLTGMVPEPRIHEVLSTTDDPQEACDSLVREANAAGGQDNITVVVLDFAEGEPGAAETAEGTHLTEQVRVEAPKRPTDTERAAAPPRAEAPSRWRRVAIWVAVALAVVVVGLVGTRLYIDTQWFVGVSDERVALYRGIPTEILGYDLFSLVEITELSADRAGQAGIQWQELPEGITASSEEDAREIIRQIEDDLRPRP